MYLFGITRKHTNWLFIFLFFNPIFPYLSNCVLSDALFGAISLTLFTQYLWMYHQPRTYNIIIQGVLIGLAFVIRYTAIYYPIVSIVAILLSGYKLPVKIAGILLPLLFIIPFILYTQQKTKELTGTAEFSVFGGWQIANNALYMYDHIKVDSDQLPEGTAELDKWAKKYFSVVKPTEEDFLEIEGTYFIKMPDAILKPYMESHAVYTHSAVSQFQAWGKVSPIYNKYGSYLIKKYPLAFIRYYMLLNAQNYFNPYLEKFGSYNIGMRSVWDPAKIWFRMKDDSVHKNVHTRYQVMVFFLFPFFFMLLNVYYLFGFAYLFFTGRFRSGNYFSTVSILTATAFLIINFGFSVFATPVVLRYQIIPMIILFFFCLHMNEIMPDSKKKEIPV
jgi:4-amino-4-deoxy-L-arabinose transferase-like glycosyltransferase